MSSLLVTRPDSIAGATVAKLNELGHSVLHAPMLHIHHRTWFEPEGMGEIGYIITSQNAIHYGLSKLSEKDSLVVVAGQKSESMASYMGFTNVICAGERSSDILSYIRAHFKVDGVSWCHLAGSHRVADLVSSLQAAGYRAVLREVYGAEVETVIPKAVQRALVEGKIKAALFYSARTLTTFEAIVVELELEKSLNTIDLIAMSDRIVDESKLTWRAVRVASTACEEEMFKLL